MQQSAVVQIPLKLKAQAFRRKKGPFYYGSMWPVSSFDMVHKNAYVTNPDGGVVNELEGFDSSLKSDTAQQITQRWIEVGSTDI